MNVSEPSQVRTWNSDPSEPNVRKISDTTKQPAPAGAHGTTIAFLVLLLFSREGHKTFVMARTPFLAYFLEVSQEVSAVSSAKRAHGTTIAFLVLLLFSREGHKTFVVARTPFLAYFLGVFQEVSAVGSPHQRAHTAQRSLFLFYFFSRGKDIKHSLWYARPFLLTSWGYSKK